MNALVQAINSAGQAFVDFALPMLVQSSVLILVVLVIDLLLRRKIRAVFRYWIWMLVLVKFVLPPSLWSPVGIGTWLGDELETPTAAIYEAVEAAPAEPAAPGSLPPRDSVWGPPTPVYLQGREPIAPYEPTFEAADGPIEIDQPQTVTASSETVSTVSWQGCLFLVWIAVAMALLLLLGQRALFVKDLIAQAEPATATTQNALADCCTHMGLRRCIIVKISPNAVSPAVCGLFHPTILIPRNVTAKLTAADLQAVLLHELAHVKRADLWVNLLQTLLQIAYFYNPLLWLGNALIRRVREKAVDETVLVAMGEKARDYPETLVNVARLAFKRRPTLSLRLVGVVESKSTLTGRIKHILGRPIPTSAKLGLPGVALVILIAAVFLPMAKARGLTDRAANIKTLARQEALRLNHTYIGTEHILLALAEQEESVSAKALKNLGADPDTLRAEVARLLQPGPAPAGTRNLTRSPAARRLMRRAREEARALDHDYVGTEHILLGLMKETDGIAFKVLVNLGVTSPRIRTEILSLVRPGTASSVEQVPETLDADDDESSVAAPPASATSLPTQYDHGIFLLEQRGSDGAGQGDDRLYLIDAAGDVRSIFAGLDVCETIGGAHMMAIDENRKVLWVAENAGDRLWKFDLATGQVAGCFESLRASAIALDPESGDVWVAAEPELIRVVSPAGVVLATYEIPGYDIAYSPSDKSFWVVGKEICRMDRSGKSFARVGGIGYAAVSVSTDSRSGHAWVAIARHPDIPESKNALWHLDPTGAVRHRIDLDELRPYCVRLDAVNDVVWVGCRGTTLRFDTNGRKLESTRGVSAFSIALTGRSDVAYLADRSGTNRVAVLGSGRVKSERLMSDVADVQQSQKWIVPIPFAQVTLASSAEAATSIPTNVQASQRVLRQLGQALATYAIDQGQLPSGLHQLPRYLSRPDFRWCVEHAEYVPGQGQKATPPGSTMAAYDKTLLKEGKGTNVLFLDGHVAFVEPDKLATLGIAAPTARRESAEKLEQLGMALLIHVADHGNRLPSSLADVRAEMSESDFWWCREHVEYIGRDKTSTRQARDDMRTAVAYDKTFLRQGQGTNVLFLDAHVEFLQPEKLETLGIPEPTKTTEPPTRRRVDLPDLETPNTNVVLDLASGQMLSGEPMRRNENHFANLNKGDIAFEYARSRAGLLCLRGARMSRRTEAGVEPLTPNVTRQAFVVYFIESPGQRFQVTTAEGQTYDVTVLVVNEGQNCTIEYSPQPKAEDAGGGGLGGTVVDSNGVPVAGAQLAICTKEIAVTVTDGRLSGPKYGDVEKSRIVETDELGRFQFDGPAPTDFCLIAAHDAGYARLELGNFNEERQIRLTPWGRIEGQLASSRTALGDKIWMAGMPNSTWYEYKYSFRYEVLSDGQGRFVFQHVPAGRFEVGYLASTGGGSGSVTSRTPVVVRAAQTTTMTLGGEGRPVIGRLVPPQGYRGPVYFGQGLRSLVTTRPQEPRPDDYDQMTQRQQQAWHKQWRNTPEARAFYEAIWSNPNWRQYCFEIQRDGSFRIEDVIPGRYDLTIWLEERFTGQGRPEEIGVYNGTVEVPPMAQAYTDEPLDLGALTLRMNNPLHVGDMAPDFEAQTLDGKTVHLTDYNGGHVLLCFWSPTFHPEVDRLKGLYADYKGTGQLQIIGLGGTDTLEEVRSCVKEHDIEWPEIYFGPDWNAELLRRLGGQMQILLIDPEGKIAATWLREDNLTDTVRQAVGEPKSITPDQALGSSQGPALDAAECMKLLGLAVALYMNDHDGRLPDAIEPLEPYFSKPAPFVWVQENVTYVGKGNEKDYQKKYAVVTGYETTARPTGQRYATFLDGHIELVELERFEELTAATATPPDQPPATLQELIDQAEPGSTVTVPKGTYSECIQITRPVTLRGASREDCVFEVTANEPAIWLNTGGQGGVALENLTIRWQLASQDRIERPFALGVKDTKVVVRNCRFAGMGNFRRSAVAINIEGSPKAVIDDCHLAGFEYVICIQAGTDAVIEDCLITDCGHQGVINYTGSTMTVRRNIITGSKYHAVRCTGGTLHVRDNLLIANANRGIYLGNKTGRGTIANNLIMGNGTGISGFGQAAYTIENNVIADNEYAGISMRDFCRLSINDNVLSGNGRGVILHKEGGQDMNRFTRNVFWNNNQDLENIDRAVTCLVVDPQFADPNGGDFSVQGSAREQGPGLTDPGTIRQLWRKLHAQPVSSASTETLGPSPAPTTVVEPNSAAFAWQRADRYVAPDPESFFPDDAQGGKRLDALFQAVDKDRRGDEEILSTVRQGFRQTTQHRTLILSWIGNRYIWGKDPQNAEAIEIMYHAVPMERHYAIYFGLSVMKHKTPNVLRTLAEICMQGEDVGRIAWGLGLGRQRQEIIPYIEPYLNDADTRKQEIASVLVRHFKGEIDFDQWKQSKRQEEAQAQFGDRLPEFREALLTGDSQVRRDTINVINRNQLAPLLDDSFLPAMAAAATDPDRKVRNDVGRITGSRWVWRAGEQNQNAIALMLQLASDTDREVRYNAVYYGLSVVRDKSDAVMRRLIEMALADHENNLYGRIVWGLGGTARDDPERFKAILSEHLESARSNRMLAASIDTLYREVLEVAPPVDWELGDISKDYPGDLFTISFSPSASFESKDAGAVWAEFVRTVPKEIIVERDSAFRSRDSKVWAARVRGQSQVEAVKKAMEENSNLVLGQVYPLSVSRQLYLQERLGAVSLLVPSEPKTPEPNEAPGPIQRQINAASPGDTVTLEPGIYQEHLIIDKPLALQGAGWEETTIVTHIEVAGLLEEMQTVIREKAGAATSDAERRKIAAEIQQQYRNKLDRPTLRVTEAKNVVIRGIKFTSPGQNIEGRRVPVPILKLSSSKVLIADCAIVGGVGNGIDIVNDSDVEIDNTLVAAVWSTGITIGDRSGPPSRVHIHDSDIRNCHYAEISIGRGNDSVRIERCRISGAAWHGIRYDDASPTIQNNLIFGNARSGIYASGKTAATIRGNVFCANEMCGISCWFQNADRIENNTFAANKRSGLEILGASEPHVRNNIFYMNPAGISAGDIGSDSQWAKSDGRMTLRGNLFWDNEQDAQRREGETMQPIELSQETETIKTDPKFTSPEQYDLSLKADSPAREAGIGAMELIPFETPWPLQIEERAIIPEGPTRDYRQWKGAN